MALLGAGCGLVRLRRDGVDFSNSHAVYPTLTTANASAIATGHFLGDTGNYGNTLYTKANAADNWNGNFASSGLTAAVPA